MKDMHLVMHGVAVKKYATLDDICSITELESNNVAGLLAEAVSKGRVADAKGKYLLTPAGQITLKSAYSKSYGELRRDEDFVVPYLDFERINNDLKQTITDWQTISLGNQTVTNDHSDMEYDAAVIDRIGEIHERVDGALNRLGQEACSTYLETGEPPAELKGELDVPGRADRCIRA
jgi:hypothetical protein